MVIEGLRNRHGHELILGALSLYSVYGKVRYVTGAGLVIAAVPFAGEWNKLTALRGLVDSEIRSLCANIHAALF